MLGKIWKGKGKMEEKSCFKDLQGRSGVKQLGESRNAGDRAAGRGLGWMDGWMRFEGGGEVIWWLLKTQKVRKRERKRTANDSSGAVLSVTCLLPRCSAAGGGSRGNGCSLWAGALPSGVPSAAGLWLCQGTQSLYCRKDRESLSHFLLERHSAGSWNQAQFCELP